MLFIDLLFICVFTIINGFLAMSEIAVVSSRVVRLRNFVDSGVKGSQSALALASDPGRFLSSVQIGITLVSILSGAFSGATLGEELTKWFINHGLSGAWASIFGLGGVITIITYLSLIIGELVPKQLALKNPEGVACKVAPAMTFLAKIAFPVIWFVDQSGKLILSLLGQSHKKRPCITEDEIKAVVFEAQSAGLLEPNETQMISRVLRLGDRPVRSVMTPRREVDMIDITAPIKETLAVMAQSDHSYFPVHSGADDHSILGVIRTKDLLGSAFSSSEELHKFIREAPIIPEGFDAIDFVETLKKSFVHVGLVYDDYGHFIGIITAADILGAIVGDLAVPDQRL